MEQQAGRVEANLGESEAAHARDDWLQVLDEARLELGEQLERDFVVVRDGLVRHEDGLARPHLVVAVELALVDGGGHRHDGVVTVSTALRVHAFTGGLSSVHDEC